MYNKRNSNHKQRIAEEQLIIFTTCVISCTHTKRLKEKKATHVQINKCALGYTDHQGPGPATMNSQLHKQCFTLL